MKPSQFVMASFIVCLSVSCIILSLSLNKMSSRASYHMNQEAETRAALEAILDRVYADDTTYFLDVLTESDEYMLYEELAY